MTNRLALQREGADVLLQEWTTYEGMATEQPVAHQPLRLTPEMQEQLRGELAASRASGGETQRNRTVNEQLKAIRDAGSGQSNPQMRELDFMWKAYELGLNAASPVDASGLRQIRTYTMVAAFSPDFVEVLLLRKPDTHTNPIFRGRWTFPGGFVESGENIAESAVRELREETNLRIKASDLWPIMRMWCNCDPLEAEHEVVIFGAITQLDKVAGTREEPVEVFTALPANSMWYLPQIRDLVIARMKQPRAALAATASAPSKELEALRDEAKRDAKSKVDSGWAVFQPFTVCTRQAKGADGRHRHPERLRSSCKLK